MSYAGRLQKLHSLGQLRVTRYRQSERLPAIWRRAGIGVRRRNGSLVHTAPVFLGITRTGQTSHTRGRRW